MTAPAPPAPDDTTAYVTQARDLTDQIRTETNGLIADVESLVRELPSFLADPALDVLASARAGVEDLLNGLQHHIDEPGQPYDLRLCGYVWATTVQGALTGVAATLNANSLETADRWKGPASEAYRAALIPQKEALTNVATGCTEINTACTALADAIRTFWIAGSVALIALVTAIIGARVAKNPWMAAAVVLAVATAAAAFGIAFSTLTSAVNSSTATLVGRLGNNAGLPDGRWPSSTARITGDASISDGDETDWHLRD